MRNILTVIVVVLLTAANTHAFIGGIDVGVPGAMEGAVSNFQYNQKNEAWFLGQIKAYILYRS